MSRGGVRGNHDHEGENYRPSASSSRKEEANRDYLEKKGTANAMTMAREKLKTSTGHQGKNLRIPCRGKGVHTHVHRRVASLSPGKKRARDGEQDHFLSGGKVIFSRAAYAFYTPSKKGEGNYDIGPRGMKTKSRGD